MSPVDDPTRLDGPDAAEPEGEEPEARPIRPDGGEGDPSAVERPEREKEKRAAAYYEEISLFRRIGIAVVGLLILAIVVYVVFLL